MERGTSTIRARLLELREPVLLVHPGLFARYKLMSLIGELRDRSGTPDGPPGVWLLVAADGPITGPIVDGTAVPVLGPSQWAVVPEAWLENRHRAATPATAA